MNAKSPTGAALLALAIATLGAARPARATGGTAIDAYDDVAAGAAVDVHGLLDVYGLYNLDEPASKRNQLRAVDVYDEPARLGYLRLTLAHRPAPIGFRVDAGLGDTAKYFERQDPADAKHPDIARATSYVEQGFVTAMIPTERAVEVDLGRYSTPMGLEDNEAWSNWSYSRGLLYTWAEPTQHTGLRVSCALTDAIAASLFWVNGWNATVLNGNAMRTGAAAVSWRATEELTLALVDMFGPEHAPTDDDAPLTFRNLLDAFATYAPARRLSFAVSVDYGVDRANGGVSWRGVAAFARVVETSWLATSLRGEVLADPDGFMTGTPQTMSEGTATVEVHGAFARTHWAGRLEGRHDHSTARVFDGATPASLAHQSTLTLALLAAFP